MCRYDSPDGYELFAGTTDGKIYCSEGGGNKLAADRW